MTGIETNTRCRREYSARFAVCDEDARRAQALRSARYDDLSSLQPFERRLLEMGCFCMVEGVRDPDIPRLAWPFPTDHAGRERVEPLFGCSRFRGTETGDCEDAFALLTERHLAKRRRLPSRPAGRPDFRLGPSGALTDVNPSGPAGGNARAGMIPECCRATGRIFPPYQ